MDWTKQTPSKPGWYWYYEDEFGQRIGAVAVRIGEWDLELMVEYPGEDENVTPVEEYNNDGYWLGPFEAPQPPTEEQTK